MSAEIAIIKPKYVAPTLEQLLQIQAERNAEFKRVNLAHGLGICSVCSETLISEPVEILEKPITFLGIVLKRKKHWDSRWICPNDKSHVEIKEMYSNYDELY